MRVVVCGQAICDYTLNDVACLGAMLWFAVRLYAITLTKTKRAIFDLLWFAVRLYAITLAGQYTRHKDRLWFAVRLYAITLRLSHQS